MYEIAICDDETKICERYQDRVKKILDEHGFCASIQIFDSEHHFIKECMKERFHLVLLDIDMPDISGMDIAKLMNGMIVRPILVFVTNQEALVYDTFQFQPLAFIRKSHFDEEIETVIVRSFEKLREAKSTYSFRYEAKMLHVKLNDIMYFEANQNYLQLYTGDQVFRIRDTLINVERELSGKGFLRIHKGFLVNQEAVYQMSGDEVVLNNKVVLPIGRTNREQIKKLLMRYMMR
jgi:DNA-binding LytR/AlgR family response regulator